MFNTFGDRFGSQPKRALEGRLHGRFSYLVKNGDLASHWRHGRLCNRRGGIHRDVRR
jgi:hypothetical protein